MTRIRTQWLTLALAPLLAFALVACDDDDGNLNDGVVAGATVATPDGNHTPQDAMDDNLPEANEIPEIVRDGLESAAGDAEWIGDVGDIERDGETLSITLDRSVAANSADFQDACNAVANVVRSTPGINIDTVEVKDDNGDVAFRGDNLDDNDACEPVTG